MIFPTVALEVYPEEGNIRIILVQDKSPVDYYNSL
jgi:hypothetical protein